MCIHGKNMWRFGISLRCSFLQEGERWWKHQKRICNRFFIGSSTTSFYCSFSVPHQGLDQVSRRNCHNKGKSIWHKGVQPILFNDADFFYASEGGWQKGCTFCFNAACMGFSYPNCCVWRCTFQRLCREWKSTPFMIKGKYYLGFLPGLLAFSQIKWMQEWVAFWIILKEFIF